jgi:hypothetical protein
LQGGFAADLRTFTLDYRCNSSPCDLSTQLGGIVHGEVVDAWRWFGIRGGLYGSHRYDGTLTRLP